MKPGRVSVNALFVAGMIACAFPLLVRAGSPGPAVGDPAPAFELPGSDGKIYSLAEYRSKQVVVLAWFPKAFTGG
jgi:peroxiredoxin Q/BCP